MLHIKRSQKGSMFTMKRQWFWVACLLVLASSTAGAAGSVNMIKNGDFEKTRNAKPANWKLWVEKKGAMTYNGVPELRQDTGFIEGKNSLYMASNPKARKKSVILYSDTVKSLIPGKQYTLSFYAKSETPGQELIVFYYTSPRTKPHWYKRKTFLLTPNWKKYTFDQKIPSKDKWKNRNLQMRFSIGSGSLYLDNVVLSVSGDTSKKESPSIVPMTSTGKNMLINPGFDLEWQGWSYERYRQKNQVFSSTDFRKIEFDYKNKKDGPCSIKMPPNNCLVSQRIPFVPGKTYTLSLYARTDGKTEGNKLGFRMFLLTPMWKMAGLTVGNDGELTSEWERYSLTFKPGDQGNAYRNTFYIRIDNYDNSVWLDSVQVEEGDKPTEYASGLQIGFKSQNKYSVFKLGEDYFNVLLYREKGLNESLLGKNSILNLTAYNVYNKTLWHRKMALKADRKQLHQLRVDLENSNLGVTKVVAEVIKGKKKIARGEWRYLVAKNLDKTINNPLFGLENSTQDTTLWAFKEREELATLAGAGFSRVFYSNWLRSPSPKGGKELKVKYRIKQKSGKKVMIVIGLKRESPLRSPGDKKLSDHEVDIEIDKFGKQLFKIASEFKDAVDYYEILNEPDIWRVNSGPLKGSALMPAERYIKILKVAHDYIKKAYPEAKIAANIAGPDLMTGFPYTTRLFELGAGDLLDAYTFHSYRENPESPPMYEQIQKLHEIVGRYNKNIKIMNSEQYYGLRNLIHHSTEDEKFYFSAHEDDFSGRIIQTFLHHVAASQTPFSLFSVNITLYTIGNTNPVYYFYSFGMYRAASQLLVNIVNSTTIKTHASLRSFVFEKRNGEKIVSLNTKKYGIRGYMSRDKLSEKVLDCNGNELTQKEIPLDYLPVYVIFPKEVSLKKVKEIMENGNYYGLDFPIGITLKINDDKKLEVSLENYEKKDRDVRVKFTKTPNEWRKFNHMKINLKGQAKRDFVFDVIDNALDWQKFYYVNYMIVSGDSILNHEVSLPSIFLDKVKQKIKIDGKLDDWDEGSAWLLNEDHLSKNFNPKLKHNGPRDLSARVSMKWDDDNIYLGIKVTDDILSWGKGGKSGIGTLYNHDSIQVYFDLLDNSYKGQKTPGHDDALYIFGLDKNKKPMAYLEKAPSGRFVGAFNLSSGIDKDVAVGYQKTSDGYIYEMKFPRVALPYLKFKKNTTFKFSLLINDNDGQGRKQGVTLGPKNTEPFFNPWIWKTVQLGD